MALLDGLKLVLLIELSRTWVSARDTIPVDDTRILLIHGPTYSDNTAYTLTQASDLANDPMFKDAYTALFIPDQHVTQYSSYHPLAEAYSTLPDVNFLQVDWGYSASDESDAKDPDIDALNPLLTDFVVELMNHVQPKNFHLITYSSGLYLAAKVSRGYITKTGTKLARFTCLDPPTAWFIIQKRLMGLKNYSADFTDTIHTAAYNQGTFLEIGQANFWPNGGIIQPGCNLASNRGPQGCSHQRAAELFAESVRNRDMGPQFCSYSVSNFVGLLEGKFLSPVIMGINADPTASGNYFLVTRGSSPYALTWCPQ